MLSWPIFDLPCLELPGELRVVTVPKIREVGIPLDLPNSPNEFHVRRTSTGCVCCHIAGKREVALWDPDLAEPSVHDLDAGFAGSTGIDAWHDRFAVAQLGSLRVLDERGSVLQHHQFDDPRNEAHCRFAADGSLWLLVQLPDGQARMLFFDSSGNRQDSAKVRYLADDDPLHMLGRAHPDRPVVPISGGMGQDGIFEILAQVSNGKVGLGTTFDHVGFVAWGPGDDELTTLSHYEAELAVYGLDGRERRKRDLWPVVLKLEDLLCWEAHRLADDVFVMPTDRGRILVAQVSGGEVLDLRLESDERGMDWTHVQLGPDRSLITMRHGDSALTVWDLSALEL